MNEFQQNLKKYLEIESILNRFFKSFDYCLTHCILPEKRKNKFVTGCCKDKYYKKYDLDHPAFVLLTREREKRFGRPESFLNEMGPSPCEYHTQDGCRLKTHKSPICLSFMCRESIDRLRADYQIYSYDYLGMNYALEWILTGDLRGQQFEDFRATCIAMTDKMTRRNPL